MWSLLSTKTLVSVLSVESSGLEELRKNRPLPNHHVSVLSVESSGLEDRTTTHCKMCILRVSVLSVESSGLEALIVLPVVLDNTCFSTLS